MAKIKSMFDFAKINGPKVGRLVKENWKELTVAGSLLKGARETAKEFNNNKREAKEKQGKIPYRKTRYVEYKTQILRDLDNKNRRMLFKHKLEVENFINQIEKEESNEVAVKKPFHSKRISNWNSILTQIKDEIKIMDYQEYIMIYNNSNYKSSYFEGYDGQVLKFKELLDNRNIESVHNFIHTTTGKSMDDINRDFS